MRAWALVLAGAGALAAAAGCASQGDSAAATAPPLMNEAAVEDLYRVSADTTGFFHYGPQQPSGPDLSLKKDTRVVMLKRSFGYSQVRLEDKEVGYVGTVDLTPLSAEELASERAARAAALNPVVLNKRSPAIVGEYTIPPEAGNRERLPEPEARATPNPAMFHY